MKLIKLNDLDPNKGCPVSFKISRRKYNHIMELISSFDKNVIHNIRNDIEKIKQIELERDSLASCDPGILALGKDGKFYDCIMWWENEDIEIIVVIDDKYFNLTRVCYIKNKHTNDVQRYLLRDSSDIYFSNLEMGITKEEIGANLLDLDLKDLSNIFLRYREIRPIVDMNNCGNDYEDYLNLEEWLGCYVDVSCLGWFIKYIFNNGLANIAIIK